MASSFTFYSALFTKLSAGLATYYQDVAANIVGAITPVATTLLTIYVMLWGWSMMRGVISEPVTDGVSRIVRLALITGIALNVGRYNAYLADMLWNSPDALAGVVASGYSDGSTNMNFLDQLLGQFYDMGQAYNDQAHTDAGALGMPDLSLWICGVAIWLAGLILTGYAAFLLALSKIALAILLGVGPLFILMTIFEPTKRFFDAWLGQALNYVFLVLLTAAAIKLVLAIVQNYLGAPGVVAALANPSVNQAFPAIVFSIIGVLVMMQLPAMASALGGGVAISTLGAVAWAYGRTKGGVAAMRPTTMKRSLLKTGRDFRIAGGVANKAMGGAPMAVYRKITGASKNRVAKA